MVEKILVTADGSRVITRGQDGDAHIWDGSSGKHLRAFQTAGQRGLALSPDGRSLVWPVQDPTVKFGDPRSPRTIHDGSRIRLYELAADKLVDHFPGFKGDADDLTFTSDGKILAGVDHRDGSVQIWDVELAKEKRSFQAVPEAEKNRLHHVWRTTLSPDGTKLAVAYGPINARTRLGGRSVRPLVRLWDVVGGQEKYTPDMDGQYILDMAFSQDGRLLVTAGEQSVFVWDTDIGNSVSALPKGLPMEASNVALTLDGRFLATAHPEGVRIRPGPKLPAGDRDEMVGQYAKCGPAPLR